MHKSENILSKKNKFSFKNSNNREILKSTKFPNRIKKDLINQ